MNSKDVLKTNLKKFQHEYEAFLLLIAVLEIAMIIYGSIFFNFQQDRRIFYFCSYFVLLFFTCAAIAVNRFSIIIRNDMDLAVTNAYVYCFILIFWSAFISALDIMGGGYPITHMTILAAVGGVITLSPLFYFCTSVLSAVCMLLFVVYIGKTALPFSFYLNYVIFFVVMFAVSVQNYRSVKEQYILNEKLEKWAGIDTLTQVFNRRSMNQHMDRLNAESACYTFALLDVDNFKSINDTYGHKEGDQSLIEIAKILCQTFGSDVFRFGGDEFAVISYDRPNTVADKISDINKSLQGRNSPYLLQVCSGIYYNDCGDDPRKVFDYADTALYEAKQSGKSRSVIYKPK